LGFAFLLAASASYAGDERGKKPVQRTTAAGTAKPKASNADKQAVATDNDDQDVIQASMAGSDPEIVAIRTAAQARVAAKQKPAQEPSKTSPTIQNKQ
jgi:hypothetical protein